MPRAGNATVKYRGLANRNGGPSKEQNKAFGGNRRYFAKGEGYKADEEEQFALRELQRRWDPDGAEANHFAFQRQWWMNIMMFAGNQWARWNHEYAQLREPRAPKWRVRYISNLIMPMVMSTLARLASDPAPLRVPPRNTDTESRSAALLAERLLTWLNDTLDQDEKREEALLWALTCGTGLLKQVYNPRIGEMQKVVNADNGKETQKPIGGIELEVANPFQIHIPPNVPQFRHFPWIIQDTPRTMHYIEEHWPEKAAFVVPQGTGSRPQFFEQRLTNLVGIRGFSGSQDVEGEDEITYVTEAWLLPFRARGLDGKWVERPKGMRIVVSGGVVLEVSENPYVDLGIGLPFVDYHWVQIPGRFWGMSLVEQLTPPQLEYNKARSQTIEYKNLMGRGKWLLPIGHGIPKSSITSEPGEIIEYNHTLPPPQMVAPPPLPGDIDKDLAATRQEMQDIAAQQDVSQAKAPGSIRSGLAVNLLQQQDMARMTIPQKRVWNADKRLARQKLLIVQNKFVASRIMAVVGRGQQWHLEDFQGADLRNHTDVRLVLDPGIPQSGVARRQEILDYLQIGVLDPANPDHQAVIFKALELGDVQGYIQERALDETRAEHENSLMAKVGGIGELGDGDEGMMPAVNPYDDHQTHFRVHRRFILSPEFGQMSPELQRACMAHLQEHEQYLQAAQAAQNANKEAAKGAPGEKGEASQPANGSGGPSDGNGQEEGGGGGGPPGGDSGGGGGSGEGGASGG